MRYKCENHEDMRDHHSGALLNMAEIEPMLNQFELLKRWYTQVLLAEGCSIGGHQYESEMDEFPALLKRVEEELSNAS